MNSYSKRQFVPPLSRALSHLAVYTTFIKVRILLAICSCSVSWRPVIHIFCRDTARSVTSRIWACWGVREYHNPS